MSATAAASLTSSNTPNSAFALQEVQETVSRIASHKGVKAVLILNADGDIVTQSGKQDVVGNAKLLKQMLDMASKYVQSIPSEQQEDQDEISFVSIRSKHDEILVAPKNDYVLVVLQDPAASHPL
jgi:dynein light chain roadblock-type